MLPPCIVKHILTFVQQTFNDVYPKQWEKQVLNAVPKSGHTSKDPKLRGVAIATIFARLYDIILDRRFNAWYTPVGVFRRIWDTSTSKFRAKLNLLSSEPIRMQYLFPHLNTRSQSPYLLHSSLGKISLSPGKTSHRLTPPQKDLTPPRKDFSPSKVLSPLQNTSTALSSALSEVKGHIDVSFNVKSFVERS